MSNNFFCLVYGIIADNCSATSNFNGFQDINPDYGRGIWVIDGSMRVIKNHFDNGGQYCIYTDGTNLTAANNTFEGSSETGILSNNNSNAEFVRIEETNTFNISDDKWRSGIEIERSVATTGVHNVVRHNIFNVSDSAKLLSCIQVFGSLATDEMHIDSNEINVFSNIGNVHGIEVRFGSSDSGTKVRGNILNYQSTQPLGSWGLYFNSSSGMTNNNEVRNNTVTGASNQSMDCSFHSVDLEGTEFCENTVDYSVRGFHFVSQNDIIFRENHVNHHDYCVYIQGSDAQIGQQYGRGNMWSTTASDCASAAAKVQGGSMPADPENSEFRVPEFNALPYLPPVNKIDPPSTPLLQWFYYDPNVDLDYCEDGGDSNLIAMTPYEGAVVLNTSALTGIPLWDLQRKVYTKLLLYPNLRPSGSPEATYFNGLAGSVIDSFGQVEQMIINSLGLSAAAQQAFDNHRQAIVSSWADLDALDAPVDFSDVSTLSTTYFASRDDALEDIAINADSVTLLENSRNQQVSQSLQNVLTFNTSITTTQIYETARKTLNDIRIRHLLREPLTQTLYQQILALAQQNADTAGIATDDVVPYVAPCDRHQFKDTDESGERANESVETQKEVDEPLRLTPNPTNGMLEVLVPGNSGGVLGVYNTSGQLIRTVEVQQNKNTVELNLAGLPPGLYWAVFSDTIILKVSAAKIFLTH